LTTRDLGVDESFFSVEILFEAQESAELVLRQYLLSKSAGVNLNRGLFVSLGMSDVCVAYAMPKQWRQLVEMYGFRVSHWRCALLWWGYVLFMFVGGIMRSLRMLVLWLLEQNIRPNPDQPYVYFSELVSENLPSERDGVTSHDIVSWYLHWYGRNPRISSVRHSARGVQDMSIFDCSIIYQRDVLLPLRGGNLLFRVAVWAKKSGFQIRVITAPRHAKEAIDGAGSESLINALAYAGIEAVVVDDIASNEACQAIADVKNTFVLSFGAAWIFKKNTIDNLFQGKLLNLHGARLPQNRGGGGFSWQIMMGNRFGFCLVHKIDEGVDTGEVVVFKEFIYPPSCRTPADFDLYYRDQNYDFVVSLLESVRAQSRSFFCMVQPEYLSTYWPRLHTPTHGWLDWSWSAAEIERFICAFDDPYSGARTMLYGKIVKLKKVFANYQDGLAVRCMQGWCYHH
jgi:methionyl-tRNA formyltransferase